MCMMRHIADILASVQPTKHFLIPSTVANSPERHTLPRTCTDHTTALHDVETRNSKPVRLYTALL